MKLVTPPHHLDLPPIVGNVTIIQGGKNQLAATYRQGRISINERNALRTLQQSVLQPKLCCMNVLVGCSRCAQQSSSLAEMLFMQAFFPKAVLFPVEEMPFLL